MKNKNESLILPDKFFIKFVQDVFLPLKKSQCVSCMFTAGGGKRTIFKHFLSGSEIVVSIFGNEYKKTFFVYIDPDYILDTSNKAYLQLILDNLLLKMRENKVKIFSDVFIDNPLIAIKKNLESLVANDWYVIFVLNDFEFTRSLPSSIYLNLESIMSIDKSRISYLFLSSINLLDESMLARMQNFKYAVTQNIRYFPLLAEPEAEYFIDAVCNKLEMAISEQIKKCIYKVCGGHLQLLKYSLNLLHAEDKKVSNNQKEVESLLLDHYQLKIICSNIWNNFTDEERNIITKDANNSSLNDIKKEEMHYLLQLGIIKVNSMGKYDLFGTLLQKFVKDKSPKDKLVYNIATKKLTYADKYCEDKFTYQEFKLLVHFISHENELITRDQVAEAIWGKLYLDKYSDWSIDKIISILRKKLDAVGFSSKNLVTIKKRGFSFSNNTTVS